MSQIDTNVKSSDEQKYMQTARASVKGAIAGYTVLYTLLRRKGPHLICNTARLICTDDDTHAFGLWTPRFPHSSLAFRDLQQLSVYLAPLAALFYIIPSAHRGSPSARTQLYPMEWCPSL